MMYRQRQPKQAGYSLVEVMVAIMVLMIAIVGPMTVASKGLKNARLAKEQTTAFFLAQEGLEMVTKFRNDLALSVYQDPVDTWDTFQDVFADGNCTEDNPCGVDITEYPGIFLCADRTCDLYHVDSGPSRYVHDTSGEPTPYSRHILTTVSGAQIKVVSTVAWGEASDQQVTLTAYLYNIYGF